MRLFTNTMEGVSMELAQNISILSNDKIEEVIKEILELPQEQAALFLKKDNTGNYMIPTKVLNNAE